MANTRHEATVEIAGRGFLDGLYTFADVSDDSSWFPVVAVITRHDAETERLESVMNFTSMLSAESYWDGLKGELK